MWSLRLGLAARGRTVPTVPPAKLIKALVKRLEELAEEISKVEESGFLSVITRGEIAAFEKNENLRLLGLGEVVEMMPQLDLPRWILAKADMYRKWLKLASLRVPPKASLMLTRLEYLYPALYVYDATGRTHTTVLLSLLRPIGVHVDESQFGREFKSLRRITHGSETRCEAISTLWRAGKAKLFCERRVKAP